MNRIKRRLHILNYLILPVKATPVMCILSILNKIIVALLPAAQILVTARLLDSILSIINDGKDINTVIGPMLFLIGIISYANINGILMRIIMTKMDIGLLDTVQLSILEKCSKLEYQHIENQNTLDLIKRVRDNPTGKIIRGFNSLLKSFEILIRVISVLLLLLQQVWWAALLILALLVPLLLLSLKSGKVNFLAFVEAKKSDRKADYISTVIQGRSTVEERTLFGYTEYCNKLWLRNNRNARRIEMRASGFNYIRLKSASIITLAVAGAITIILVYILGSGEISLGLFIGFATAIFNMVKTLSNDLTRVTGELSEDMELLKDFYHLKELSEVNDALVKPKSIPFEKDGYVIEFKRVSFKYPGTERSILNEISLLMESGRHYAFVGINGTGKTTLIKLLLGLYDNYSGEILINGRELKIIPMAEKKSLFSVVYQDFAKYCITFRDSIMLGNVNDMENSEKLSHAVKSINLENTISSLPDGINTPIGKIIKSGIDLSGGEWQRIAISRAIVKDSSIVILDEPTAAQDPIAESNTYKMFDKISKGKTTIFVTHRLGATKIADKIFLISEGVVKEEGTHDELMKLNGRYAEMYDKQRWWYN